jgi:hypothetical protein
VQQHHERRPRDAGDEKVEGGCVEEGEYEGDLAEGDALCLAADLDVQDPDLGGGEEDRQDPPRDVQPLRGLRWAGPDDGPEDGAEGTECGDEEQHPPGRAGAASGRTPPCRARQPPVVHNAFIDGSASEP